MLNPNNSFSYKSEQFVLDVLFSINSLYIAMFDFIANKYLWIGKFMEKLIYFYSRKLANLLDNYIWWLKPIIYIYIFSGQSRWIEFYGVQQVSKKEKVYREYQMTHSRNYLKILQNLYIFIKLHNIMETSIQASLKLDLKEEQETDLDQVLNWADANQVSKRSHYIFLKIENHSHQDIYFMK